MKIHETPAPASLVKGDDALIAAVDAHITRHFGMSQRPMPDGSYAELMLVLPPSWPVEGDPAFETPEGYWP